MRILGYYAFAFLQAPVASEPAEGFGSLFSLVVRQSLIGQVVLASLLIFSVVSWAVILFKLWQFRRVDAQTSTFVAIFRKSRKFSEVQSVCKSLAASPLSGVFQAGYVELNAQLRDAGSRKVEAKIDLSFADGLPLKGDAAETLTERLCRFASGAAYVSATAEAKSDGAN